MGGIATESIRAAALVGHAGSGKTLLTETLLHQAGAITVAGTIERGSTVSDFDALEKQHQHSMYSTPLCFDFRGTRIHLIDTPGYPDFLGQSISALQAVDTVVVVINAQSGIELTTTRMMEWAQAPRSVPHDRHQQDRRARYRSAGVGRAHSGDIRQGVPADQSACRGGEQSGRLLLQPRRANRISPRWPKRTARSSTRWWRSTKT